MVRSTFKPTKKVMKQQESIATLMNAMEAVRMLSLYSLRNQGYGRKRLLAFNDKFNEYAIDVSNGLFSMSDILGVMEAECGLSMDDLKLKGVFTL